MSEVVALNGGITPATAEPRESVITLLREALARAESGQMQAVGLVYMDADSLTSYALAGVCGSYSLVGGAYVLAAALVEETSD